MIEMLEKSANGVRNEEKLDPRLAEVVRIIIEQFGGDVSAYINSIKPKAKRDEKAERLERQLVETATRAF